jgi:hypothetical protein
VGGEEGPARGKETGLSEVGVGVVCVPNGSRDVEEVLFGSVVIVVLRFESEFVPVVVERRDLGLGRGRLAKGPGRVSISSSGASSSSSFSLSSPVPVV